MPSPQILDLSHHNQVASFRQLAASGIAGVILKATQGTRYIDPNFAEHRDRARSVGLVVQAYHFLDGSDPDAQVAHFLSVTRSEMFGWLDFEDAPTGTTQCTLDIAAKAAQRMHKITGKWPGIYGSDKGLLGQALDQGRFAPVCPIWIARYGRRPSHPCLLWQYSENALVSGVSGLVDANVCLGQLEEWAKL